MRFLSEFRDARLAAKLVAQIRSTATRRWTIMEVCGGQTHAIIRYGIHEVLDDQIRLIHGPGCPVCVTPMEYIDRAIAIARRPGVVFCTFGDMLRVPGSTTSLLEARSEGADIRVVYSSTEALRLADQMPDREVVFFGIGFETTAPSTAFAIDQANAKKMENFSVLCCHVRVAPAMVALLVSEGNLVQAYLAAGHVCAVQGESEYEAIAEQYNVPIVVTGFEPIDILAGILAAVNQLERGEARVENQYSRVVRKQGNSRARAQVEKIFEVCDRKWRGMGDIPASGYRIRPAYSAFDAESRFDTAAINVQETERCISGDILRGLKRPTECPSFGTTCTPAQPLGAPMVSSEGACAAYYNYGHAVARSTEGGR